jgi:DNA sulfur modification protein DndC
MFDEKTIQMFRPEELVYSIEERIDMALATIISLFQQSRPIVVSYSGGKDSSVVASLTLHASLLAKQAGVEPMVVVTTSDTLVESPEVVALFRSELSKMRKFGEKHGINVLTKVVQPSMLSTWQVKVLTGRGLPSFPGGNGDCSVDLKIRPQLKFRKELFKSMENQGLEEPISLLGSRLEESERRALNMKFRGDRADVPVRNKDGDLVLTPLKSWSTDDVWEAIALYGSQHYPSYSDFEDIKRTYAHAAGTSCAVVADAIYEGGEKRRQGKCGSRLGCHLCQMAEDKSLEAMVAYDERYEYARGLNRLNQFIRNTQHDWTLRNWVGRTIQAGYICVEPDTYSPRMVRTLTQFMLQLDFDEQVRASRDGGRPKFELLPLDIMIAVDAFQSLQGIARPFAVWADYHAIRQGVRFDIPDVEKVRKTPMPAARFLYVGKDWESTLENSPWAGLRDPVLEGLTEDSGCAPNLVELKNGRIVWGVEKSDVFSVDAESAMLIEEFEIERLLQKHDDRYVPGGITAAYKWYLMYGCLNLSASQLAKHDEICRRTTFKDQHGLTLDYDLNHLLAQSVGFSQLPDDARAAWAHKATMDSAQTEFDLSLV